MVILAAMLAGCGQPPREFRERQAQVIAQATETIRQYCMDKYGVDVNIIETYNRIPGGGIDGPDYSYVSPLVCFEVEAGGEVFTVYTVHDSVCDNRQRDEIARDMAGHVSGALGLPMPDSHTWRAKTPDAHYAAINENFYTGIYYDGTNIAEIYADTGPEYRLLYVGETEIGHLLDGAKPEAPAGNVEAEVILLKPEMGLAADRWVWKDSSVSYFAPYVAQVLEARSGPEGYWVESRRTVADELSAMEDVPGLEGMLLRYSGEETHLIWREDVEQGWALEAGYVTIGETYRVAEAATCTLYVPGEVWRGWQQQYDEIELCRYSMYEDVYRQFSNDLEDCVYGDYYVVSPSGHYFTFCGIPKA